MARLKPGAAPSAPAGSLTTYTIALFMVPFDMLIKLLCFAYHIIDPTFNDPDIWRVPDGTCPEEWKKLSYGEMDPASVERMLQTLDLKPSDNLIDIGAGTGKVVIQAALQSNVGTVTGVEIVRARFVVALRALARLLAVGVSGLERRVRFVNADVLNMDLSDITVVYMANTVRARARTPPHARALACPHVRSHTYTRARSLAPIHARTSGCRRSCHIGVRPGAHERVAGEAREPPPSPAHRLHGEALLPPRPWLQEARAGLLQVRTAPLLLHVCAHVSHHVSHHARKRCRVARCAGSSSWAPPWPSSPG
jgi:hypothetical protein